MKIVSKIINIGASNSGYNYVISGCFFDPNQLGHAKFFFWNEDAPLHERCVFILTPYERHMKVHLHMAARIRDFLSNPRFWRKIFSNIFRAEALAGRCEKWPTQGFVVSRIKRTYVAYFHYFYLKQIHKNWIKRAFMHIHLLEFSWWNAIVFH